jgi:hypothetical protein
MRQWLLSFPFPLRFLFASRPGIMGRVPGIVYRVIATDLVNKACTVIPQQQVQAGAEPHGSVLPATVLCFFAACDAWFADRAQRAGEERRTDAVMVFSKRHLDATISSRMA